MSDPITVAVAAEVAAAVLITGFNVREILFLRRLRPLLPPDDDLPLYDALVMRAEFLAGIGLYLLVLTLLSALGFAIAAAFPLIRALNGLVFLGILAGPLYLGRAMRRHPVSRQVTEVSDD